MKRIILASMFFVALLSIGSVLFGHSKKNFLMPRAVGVNAVMEHVTWQSQIYVPNYKHKINSYIHVTPFYQTSDNKHVIGGYFGLNGVNGSNVITFGNTAKYDEHSADLDGAYFIHNNDLYDESPINGTMFTLNPEQEVWGARLDFFQTINIPIKDLFFRISMPVVHIENNVKMGVTFPVYNPTGVVSYAGTNVAYNIIDFFAGRVTVDQATSGANMQLSLTKAKVDGRQSKNGVADIDLSLGYKLLFKKTKYAFFDIGITIPTGNTPRGDYLFESVCGNGGHVGLGTSLNVGLELWKCEKYWIRVDSAVKYKYLFESTEKRTLGIKDMSGKSLPYGQYYLGGVINQPANTAYFPLANEVTRDVNIKPGSQIDSLINFSFNTKHFVIDFGCNMYWKDDESLSVKNWKDGVYAIATTNDLTDADFVNVPGGESYIEFTLDPATAKTPTQLTHKIFAGFAYKTDISKCYPTFVGFGGSYEFVSKNSALEQYALWVKAGLSF